MLDNALIMRDRALDTARAMNAEAVGRAKSHLVLSLGTLLVVLAATASIARMLHRRVIAPLRALTGSITCLAYAGRSGIRSASA